MHGQEKDEALTYKFLAIPRNDCLSRLSFSCCTLIMVFLHFASFYEHVDWCCHVVARSLAQWWNHATLVQERFDVTIERSIRALSKTAARCFNELLPSRKSWCCEFGHIAVLDSTRASSQYCGFIAEWLLIVVWNILTYVVYILQNDDQYRRNPKIIKFGQNNQTFHILFIWLLVCQYRTSTHVQIKCLKTTIQWVPMHGLGLAIGPYIVSIISNIIYIYIYTKK